MFQSSLRASAEVERNRNTKRTTVSRFRFANREYRYQRTMALNDKSVVITGGGGGIGIGIARHFLTRGARKIALLDIKSCDEVIAALRGDFPSQKILFHLTDVSKRDDVVRAFSEVFSDFGVIDMVITSAGILDERNYQLMVDINLVGIIHTNYVAIDHMSCENGASGGVIINIASCVGVDCTQFSTPVYNATKHAVTAFTRSMGHDFYYRHHGLKFITVCPGVTLTAFLENLDEKFLSKEAHAESNRKVKDQPKQTVTEFVDALETVIDVNKNGSVWLIDGGKAKEIHCKDHWFESNAV